MNGTNSILTLQLFSFLTFTAGYGSAQLTKTQIGNTSATLPPPQQLMAWAGLTLILLFTADLGEGPEQVAQALAVLIFLTVLLLYGYDVFTKFTAKVSVTSTTTPTPLVPRGSGPVAS